MVDISEKEFENLPPAVKRKVRELLNVFMLQLLVQLLNVHPYSSCLALNV